MATSQDNRSETQLQHLTTIPLIPVDKIYQHMINGTQHIIPFNMNNESTEDTGSIWTLFLHTGLFCCYFFGCRPARLAH